MDLELPLRVTVLRPPAQVTFRMQRGRTELVAPARVTDVAISFDAVLRARGKWPAGGANFTGPLAHGPPERRFLYVNSGLRAGQADSCWDRRAKVPLDGITWELVERTRAAPGAVLEGRIQGTAPDGGPVCATVELLEAGWRVVKSAAA